MTLIVTGEINLKEQELTHAKGKNDKCNGLHEAQVEIDEPFDVDGLENALQVLHEAAHPDGALSFRYCFKPGCGDAAAALDYKDGA